MRHEKVSMGFGFVITLLAAAAWFCALMVAIRKNRFAQYKRGFRITLMIGLLSLVFWSSLLIAYWGYAQSYNILVKGTDTELSSVANIVQHQIDGAVQDADAELHPASDALASVIESGQSNPTEQLAEFNPRFLDAHVIREPFDRSTLMHPRYNKNFKTYTIDVEVATHHQQCPPESFVVSYDIGRVFSRLVDSIRFGKTGYVVVVNDDGHIIAHPDPKRIGDDVSSYEAVRRVQEGDKEMKPIKAVNKAGVLRLFDYRPVYLPNNKRPLAVLAEMDVAELEQPIRTLLRDFALMFCILVALGLLLATQISGSLYGPMEALVSMVHRVQNGIFSVKFGERRQDEIGQLASGLDNMTTALEERDRVKDLFGKYVTSQISEEVLRGHVNLGGQARRVTMLISDIRGFTAMSEQMSAEQVVQFLNEYFSEMVDAVFEYGGVLDKFLGDGLLAVYGSLSEHTDHPRRAVASAIRMQAKLKQINERRNVQGLAPIQIGIGIHTGEVVVGNIGSQKRLEYTVIGDGVNITSRLESLNKDYSTMILISEETYKAVEDNFDCVEMPEAKLRGRSKTIHFYEVVGPKGAREAPVVTTAP